VSLHFVAEAATVLQWSRLSDHIGRKPVLMLSLVGTAVSTILFGLSRSLWALILRFDLLVVKNKGDWLTD
jgi:MFS family permease